ncbi:MAG: DsrE family protein [Candidatus Thorarchaeota archaeon]
MEDYEKQVVICLIQPPIGTLFPVEGLRMTVALSGDMEPVTVAMDDGVYAFLKGCDRTMYQEHFDFIKEIELEILVDKRALDERGLTADDLIEGVEVKEHEEIHKLLSSVDVVIPF